METKEKEVKEELQEEKKKENKKVEKTKKEKKEKVDKEKETLKEKNAELNDKILRVSAEMQNMRRRYEEQISNIRKFDGEDVIKDMLATVDNFERALQVDEEKLSDELSKFLNGFKMIYTNLVKVLDAKGVKEIECVGLEFDPNSMQAVLTDNVEGFESNQVTEVLQKGYKYNDKVIRPAMVKVQE